MNHPSAQQVVAARALLGISQRELAAGAGVSLSTIRRFEATATLPDPLLTMRLSTMLSIISFFEVRGVEFWDDEKRIGVLISKNQIL